MFQGSLICSSRWKPLVPATVLLLLYNPDQKRIKGSKYFILQCPGCTPPWREVRGGAQGRDVDTGAGAEDMEGCPYCLAQPASYRTQGHHHGSCSTYSGLGPPSFINNQENAPTGNLMKAIPRLRFPIPR